jgi:TonB family protein
MPAHPRNSGIPFRLFINVLSSVVVALALRSEASAKPRLAIVSLGTTETARRAVDELNSLIKANDSVSPVDSDLAMAAARGAGYNGSLNLTREEARNLGAAIGCEYFIIGDAQTIRRTRSDRPKFFESYASLFFVNARDGRLVSWVRPRAENDDSEVAQKELIGKLGEIVQTQIALVIKDAAASPTIDAIERQNLEIFEEAPADEVEAKRQGVRLPQPFRRLKPEYPQSAAEADAEGTVDIEVFIDKAGEVADIKVERWAGFGLDDAAIAVVRRLHFRPATENGVPVPMRVLLRYNFRKPEKL